MANSSYLSEVCQTMGMSYRGAHRVAHTEVKATLFIHGVMQTRKLRQRGPVVVKWVITETVIGTARIYENILVSCRIKICAATNDYFQVLINLMALFCDNLVYKMVKNARHPKAQSPNVLR